MTELQKRDWETLVRRRYPQARVGWRRDDDVRLTVAEVTLPAVEGTGLAELVCEVCFADAQVARGLEFPERIRAIGMRPRQAGYPPPRVLFETDLLRG